MCILVAQAHVHPCGPGTRAQAPAGIHKRLAMVQQLLMSWHMLNPLTALHNLLRCYRCARHSWPSTTTSWWWASRRRPAARSTCARATTLCTEPSSECARVLRGQVPCSYAVHVLGQAGGSCSRAWQHGCACGVQRSCSTQAVMWGQARHAAARLIHRPSPPSPARVFPVLPAYPCFRQGFCQRPCPALPTPQAVRRGGHPVRGDRHPLPGLHL
jgi:hypothetical protein